MLGACQQQGGDPDAILMAGGLTSFDIEREQGRILAHSHYRMLSLMQPYLGSFHETILSYDIGQLYQHYPALISLCLNQPSPRAAIEALLAYRTVIGNCDDFVVRRGALFSQYEY
ncbi:MAG: AraC family transcriptional regulator, partial [Aeromonas sobria]